MTIVTLTSSDIKLRDEIRRFLDKEFPEKRQVAALTEQHEDQEHIDQIWERSFWKKLAANGWLGLGIPTEYGGTGGTVLQRNLFTHEMSYYGAPYPRCATQIVAPALLSFGSEELKRSFLPPIAGGEINTCLGYTEPDSGTDLASIQSRAVRHGDGYTVNARKIYTTRAHRTEYCYMAVRTSTEGKRQSGISMLLVDMSAPGVSIEPLLILGGRTNFTYFDDVWVDAVNLVGEENGGWRVLTHSLGLERIGVFPTGHIQRMFEEVARLAKRPRPDGSIPWRSAGVRRRIVDLQVDLRVLQSLLDGAMAEIAETGNLSSYNAASIKAYLTEYKQRLADAGMELLGPYGQLTHESDLAPFDGIMETLWRDAIVHTFGGGANEVQRDMIATGALGLARNR